MLAGAIEVIPAPNIRRRTSSLRPARLIGSYKLHPLRGAFRFKAFVCFLLLLGVHDRLTAIAPFPNPRNLLKNFC